MKPLILSCALILTCLLICLPARGDEKRDKFDAQFRQAQALLKQDKLAESYAAVQAAARIDPTRYEASGLAALVLLKGGKITAAREALAEARKLAPAEAGQKLDGIAKLIETAAATTSAGMTNSSKAMPAGATGTSALTGAARRKYDTLMVIVGEADHAKSAGERKRLLGELMEKSREFVREIPDALPVWTLRAAASLELEQERMAWEASSELIRLGAENSDDTRIRQLLAKIDRKGWLRTPKQMTAIKEEEERQAVEAKLQEERRLAEAKAAEEKRIAAERELAIRREAEAKRQQEELRAADERRIAEQQKRNREDELRRQREATLLTNAWVNSLGMKFMPTPNTNVMFCIWETRIRDYIKFVDATGYNYPQLRVARGPDNPIVFVSHDDARAFCTWLTKLEKKSGVLKSKQFYRLPTDSEWSAAVGLTKETGKTPKEKGSSRENRGMYPWGAGWPPPWAAGNFSDETFAANKPHIAKYIIKGYRDGFAETAPVGSFAANPLGLYDMAGNVREMCEDWYDEEKKSRVLRGGAWDSTHASALGSSGRSAMTPESRLYETVGFRIVLVGLPAR